MRFYGYTPAAELADPVAASGLGPVRVLARFDDPAAAPAVVTRAYGQGAVMMVCTSADTEWTDWPKDYTFLPFVNDMLDYLCRPGGGGLTALVGEQINYSLGPELAGAKAQLQTPAFPAEDVMTLEGRWVGQRRRISYANTIHAGVYRLKLDLPGQMHQVLFARNPDSLEGRLEQVSGERLSALLGVEFTYIDKLSSEAAADADASQRREYWKLALAAMLMVLAAEVFLGQRFGHYR